MQNETWKIVFVDNYSEFVVSHPPPMVDFHCGTERALQALEGVFTVSRCLEDVYRDQQTTLLVADEGEGRQIRVGLFGFILSQDVRFACGRCPLMVEGLSLEEAEQEKC
ncbi:hypothetical protein ABEB36_010359 [Hypothenemus hampei]|uniref:Uncharacterized protein n=1 Tax=Hypothenemus hampei TaxID=57062 RepID=A0ABD1EJH0_HYPHA